MNFDFIIRAHGFEKAAAVEDALKKIGVPYEVNQSKSVASGKRKRRVLSKAEVMAVAHEIFKHPDRTIDEQARASNVSRATVERIKKGIHPHQKKENVSPIKGAKKK